MKSMCLACILAAVTLPAAAQEISLQSGDYIWTNDWGCSTLSLGTTFGYAFDAGCDGSIDYIAQQVYLDGNRIWMDDAFLELETATAAEVRGDFHFNGVNPAVFVRQ